MWDYAWLVKIAKGCGGPIKFIMTAVAAGAVCGTAAGSAGTLLAQKALKSLSTQKPEPTVIDTDSINFNDTMDDKEQQDEC